jgi:general secretion pathway protein D
MGGKESALAARVLITLATIFGLTNCSQLPSISNQSPNLPGGAANFSDLLNSNSAHTPSNQQSKAANGPSTPHVAGGTDGNKDSNTQAVIYDGGGVVPQIVTVGSSEHSAPSQPTPSQPGISPVSFVVADNTVAPVDNDRFQVGFENADIAAVARAILGDALKVNYTIDPRTHGTISLSAQRPVSRSQLLLMLESALQSQGTIMVHQDNVYRLLPANQTSGVGSANIGPDAGPPGFGITALPLQNISAEALNKILTGFGATPDSVHIDPTHNLLIVRGSTSERQWLIDTALAFDVDWMRNHSVGIFPIKNSSPEVVINEINQMADPTLLRLQPIGRLNAVLAVAKSPEGVRQVQTWITRLDRENDYGPRAHIYRLKIADARKVVDVLKDTFGSGGSKTGGQDEAQPGGTATASSQGTQTPSTASTTNKPDLNPQRTGESGQGAAGEGATTGKLRITADVVSNSVIVYASQEEYKPIERAIIELDRPTPEVAIEAIAAEVTLNDNLNYGVQYFLQGAFKNASGNVTPTSGGLLSASGIPLGTTSPGANLVLGALGNPSVVISALRDVTDVKVLSSPSLVVADNQAAVLQVGDQVPVTTGTATSVITTQSAIVNSVSYVDTGIILHVTPHISRTSQVRLDIEQEVSAVENNSSAATLTPTISKQRVKSTVEVDSGETVLLAGLISQQRSQEKSGIPGATDIPIVGNMLSNSTNTASRTELIVFVKPQIIRNKIDAEHVAQGLRERMPGFGNW